MPPRRLLHHGEERFVEAGDELRDALVDLAGLEPSDRVVEGGCGFGRLARALTENLEAEHGGAYIGFDVDAVAVGWCQARYPAHFSFALADVYDRRWRRVGAATSTDYRFPCADGWATRVVLASVLTHLLEQEAEHYLAETARVLAPGGHALLGLFVLDHQSRASMDAEHARRRFLDAGSHVAVLSDERPEEAVAYDAAWLAERLAERGLRVRGEVRRGAWRAARGIGVHRDLVVVEPCA